MATKQYVSPESIEEIAQEILDDAEVDTTEPGSVDTVKLANFLDSTVNIVQFSLEEVFVRAKRGPKGTDNLIEISSDADDEHQRFSIAHGLSHLILHCDKEFVEYRRPLLYYNDQKALLKEIQANVLAAAILMPNHKKLVARAWKNTQDIGDLAAMFNVSVVTAYYRLDNLGLL